ncbi:phage tail tape measure protein [Shinella curvata]|uniref:Phage tail tape measure protein n=1 Tax=Shinella curvata TaxID=1817964 RepID=A0ABT8XHR3_9HYPH|nr:phage tail tape measure protein [Shinella curvata]MCJ8053895.1 phage tail tape measure protein [Shinella curvata]MDO6123227.1 phage tail tape measure protein [Shinella curvata]
MADDEERLIVLLEARIKDLEKNMAKASGITGKTYREMSLGSKRATDQMEEHMIRSTTRINQALATTSTKIGAFGKAMIGGFVGGMVAGGFTGILSQVHQVADAVAEVGDQAKMAGLSTKVFQEWKFVAEQARIPIDAITDGLKELQLRADEFAVTGKGSAAEAFQRLGLTPQEIKEKLKDPSELLLLIIERTRQMKDTAAGIRIFDELFGGTGGERMVALLEQGEGAIRDQIQAANELGVIMDDQLIQKAAEVNRKFDAISMTIGVKVKSALVSVSDTIWEMIEGLKDFEEQRSSLLQKSQADMGMQRVDLENERMRIAAGDSANLLYRNPNGPAAKGRMDEIDRELAKLNERDAQIAGILYKRTDARERTTDRTWTPPEYTAPADSGGKGGKARAASIAAAERERQAIKDLIAELEEELRLVNASDAEKRAAAASRQAGAAATEKERDQVVALTEAIHKEEEAKRLAEERTLLYRDLTRSAIDDLAGALEDGKSLWEALGDVAVNSLKRIADTVLDDVLDSIFQVNNAAGGSGGGLLGGLFSGIFGGGAKADPWAGMRMPSFDGGGYTGMGSRSGGIDGKGGFPAILHPRETVTDHTRFNQASAASSAAAPISRSVIQITLSPELLAQVLDQAKDQTVQIVRQNNVDLENVRQNGGNY